MKMAIIGAYGAVGHRLAERAMARHHRVTALGRKPERLAHVSADVRRVVALGDTDAIARVAATHDVVANATGSEDPRLAKLVTDAGAAFADISADGGYLDRLARLRIRRPVAAGIGLAPGLTNLLAASVPGVGPVHIGIIGGVGEPHGDAARRWIWGSAGQLVSSGDRAERVYRTGRRFDVPSFGRRTLLRAAFGEQDQLAADLGRPVSTWLGLDPAVATVLLRLAGAWPWLAPRFDRLSKPFVTMLGGHDRWGLVVTGAEPEGGVGPEGWAGPVRWASGRGEADATAALALLFLEVLPGRPPGVYPAHRLLDLADVAVADLAGTGVRFGPGVGDPGPGEIIRSRS